MPSSASVHLPHRRPGRCRFCRCTDQRACPEGCGWYDSRATVCDSPVCVARFRLAVARQLRKLLEAGLAKQKSRAFSCYHEAAIIADSIIEELKIDLTEAKAAEEI
jgi:hypothetical protein